MSYVQSMLLTSTGVLWELGAWLWHHRATFSSASSEAKLALGLSPSSTSCHRHSRSWNSCSKKWVATHLRVQVIGVVWESRKSATLPACSQTPRPALTLFLRVFGPEFELAMSSLITLSLYLIFFFFLRYNLYLNIKLKMRPEWRPPGIKQSLPLQHWGSQAVSWGLASCAEKQCSVLTHVWEAPYWAISQTWTAAGHSLRQTPAPYHHNVNSSSTKGHWWLWETDALHFPQISSF